MNVSDIMNVEFKKFSIDKDRLVVDALELMDKNKTSILLCIDKKKKLKGIITERDLLDRLGSKKAGSLKTSSIRVSSVMVYDPETVEPDSSVYDAARLMSENNYTGLPVVNGAEPVGFISQNELLNVCLKVNTIKVEELVNKSPITLSEDDRIIHARRIFFEREIHSILLKDEKGINGFVTEGMLARAFANFRENVPAVHQEERIKQITLASCRKVPFFISKDTSISRASEVMLDKGVRILVAYENEESFYGTITKDILTGFVGDNMSIVNNN
ncbi:MAG: CBS domain-containing protein [Candidatus Lokiarchaeota archaeon]|nr:CBS domain-containing protein [Candidatus Lokiarchaeota archaeon]